MTYCSKLILIPAVAIAAALLLPAFAFAQVPPAPATAPPAVALPAIPPAQKVPAAKAPIVPAPAEATPAPIVPAAVSRTERRGGAAHRHRAHASTRPVAVGNVPGRRYCGQSSDGRPCLCFAADLDYLVCQGLRIVRCPAPTAPGRSKRSMRRARSPMP